MKSSFIGLGIVSGAIIAGFNSWQLTKILLWTSIVALFLTVILGRWKNIKNCIENYANKNDKLANFYHLLKNSPPYIFLLRIPIITGLFLFTFPIIANFLAPTFLQNIFAMKDGSQLISVMITSALTSIMIISLSKTILAAYFEENLDYQLTRIIFSIFLVIPTWVSIYYNSYQTPSQEIQKTSFILGLAISLIMLGLVALYDLRNTIFGGKLKNFLDNNGAISRIPEDLKNPKNPRKRRILFFCIQSILGVVLHLLIIIAYRPEGKGLSFLPEAPVLLYLLLLIWVFTLLLGGATYLFDKSFKKKNTNNSANNISFRFPFLICIILFIGFSYSVWEVDHYFELIPIKVTEDVDYQKDFKMAIDQRLKNQKEEKTLVVVAASGGGIQASGWTTQVLAGLQQEKELGEPFTNAIGLISSVSGGSVGTMFYLDQFDPGKSTPTNENLKKALSNSTDDWLDAVGWGLAYPDLVRAIGLPFLNFGKYKYQDRGYSLEKDWQQKLQSPPTLEDWHQRILAGEIPIPVFNSTLVENGSRFLISPMKFISGKLSDPIDNPIPTQKLGKTGIIAKKALDFKTLYADACNTENTNSCDIKKTTAARLSASFPYVTPMARNDRDNEINLPGKPSIFQNYHMADGGYFDNSGLFTAIEWLDEFLTSSGKDLNIKKVILIQINAFPDSQFTDEQKGAKGLDIVALGPVKALYSVKDSTQRARNIREVQLLSDRWKKENIKIARYVISFPDGFNPPLSWRLTQQQKNNLEEAWNTANIQNEVKNIINFWKEKA